MYLIVQVPVCIWLYFSQYVFDCTCPACLHLTWQQTSHIGSLAASTKSTSMLNTHNSKAINTHPSPHNQNKLFEMCVIFWVWLKYDVTLLALNQNYSNEKHNLPKETENVYRYDIEGKTAGSRLLCDICAIADILHSYKRHLHTSKYLRQPFEIPLHTCARKGELMIFPVAHLFACSFGSVKPTAILRLHFVLVNTSVCNNLWQGVVWMYCNHMNNTHCSFVQFQSIIIGSRAQWTLELHVM